MVSIRSTPISITCVPPSRASASKSIELALFLRIFVTGKKSYVRGDSAMCHRNSRVGRVPRWPK